MFCSWCDSKLFESDRTCPRCGAPTRGAILNKNNEESSFKTGSQNLLEKIVNRALEELSIISGAYFLIDFNISDVNNKVIFGKCEWELSEYVSDVVVVKRKGDIEPSGKVSIPILNRDTEGLSGKYVQRLRIMNSEGIIGVFSGIVRIVPQIT